MQFFEYSALDQTGNVVRGKLQSQSMDTAAQQLAGVGLRVQAINLVTESPSFLDQNQVQPQVHLPNQAPYQAPIQAPSYAPYQSQGQASYGPGESPRPGFVPPPTTPRGYMEANVYGALVGNVDLNHLHFFFRQLGTMLKAGINPAQALTTLSTQSKSGKLAAIIRETSDHVISGRPMSAGFERYPEVFSPLMLSMVRTGEGGAGLDTQILNLADYIERDIKLRDTIRRETAYPKVIIVASIFIISATNLILGSLGSAMRLPNMTVIWIIGLVILILGFLFVRVGLKNPVVLSTFHKVLLVLPGFSKMVHGFAMAKWGRAFGALYKAGVPIHRAFELSAGACGNQGVREQILPASRRMEEGVTVSEAMRGTGAFSPIALDMADTGERTGNLDHMLENMAEFYEREGAAAAQRASIIFGVVCLILVGIYVLFVLITFYMGYFGGLMNAAE
ncbi:MAG: type II secretion system F family protein [Fimbriimonadaceae bacterium]|jgi:type IV pilus assembly protein PilC/MSHA biogenesis protein MshG|nr:type II secretion system F family protein [Fimbriimonadaceae bacterium]